MSRSNKMSVLGRPPWYDHLDDIAVKEMNEPCDLAADLTTGHLYIADWGGQCEWRLEVKGEQDYDDKENIKVDKLNIVGRRPWSSLFKPLSPSVTETGQVLLAEGRVDHLLRSRGHGRSHQTEGRWSVGHRSRDPDINRDFIRRRRRPYQSRRSEVESPETIRRCCFDCPILSAWLRSARMDTSS